MKLGLNWETLNLIIAAALTVFTEILFLHYLQYRQGYIVAYCYLMWTLVVWYYMIHKRISAVLNSLLGIKKIMNKNHRLHHIASNEPLSAKTGRNRKQPNDLQGRHVDL